MIVCALSKQFNLEQWLQISREIISMTSKGMCLIVYLLSVSMCALLCLPVTALCICYSICWVHSEAISVPARPAVISCQQHTVHQVLFGSCGLHGDLCHSLPDPVVLPSLAIPLHHREPSEPIQLPLYSITVGGNWTMVHVHAHLLSVLS